MTKTTTAEPHRGEPVEAVERVLLATWSQLARFHGQREPLIERGQSEGVFRRDLSVSWQPAIRAIVHAASREIRGGRIAESEVEAVMLSTVLGAVGASSR